MRGILFNLIFILYAWLLQPYVLSFSDVVINQGGVNPTLGVLILIILFLEMWAFKRKLAVILKRIFKVTHDYKVSKLIYLLLLAHLFIGFFLLAVCLESFGLSIKNKSIGTIFYLILVLREIPFFYFLNNPKGLKNRSVSVVQENLSDIGLIIYACIAYTISWESLGLHDVFSSIHFPTYTNVELFIVSIFFLLFAGLVATIFLSFRIPYLIEELALSRSFQDKIYFLLSFIVAFGSMVLPLF